MNTFTLILEILGTFAFAVSGIRLASQKRFDLFGAYVVGVATAIGGGTIRDLLLNIPVFWMSNSIYLVLSGVALAYGCIPSRFTMKQTKAILVFDTLGLALFNIVGLEKTVSLGFPWWTAIVMGTITGAAGGVIRDVLVGQVPLIFQKEIYAMACVVGGVVYFICLHFGLNAIFSGLIGGMAVILMRYLAITYRLALPHLPK